MTYSISKENPIGEFELFGTITVTVKDPLEKDIDLRAALEIIEDRIPPHLLDGLESIYIGNFPHLEERSLDAAYEDGTMYVSNVQESAADMITDIIHEIAHVAEEAFGYDLYADGSLEKEFLFKRHKLFHLLRKDYDVKRYDFLETEYEENFDMFLYKTVTYPVLTNLTIGLFTTPYGATSLREYFANSFEEFFSGNSKTVKKISPEVYNKIETLLGD